MDIFEEHPEFKDEDHIYDWCASMEVMYELITDKRSFEEFLIDYGAIYTSTTTSNVQVSYGNLKPNDYIVFPYDPTNIRLEDLQNLLTYYEELEQYEKCMVIKQRIDEYDK